LTANKKKLTPRKVAVTFLRATLLAVLTSTILFYIPTPYVLRAPGRTASAGPMVHILDQKTYPSYGQLLITTVFIEKASALACLYSMMEPDAELVPSDGSSPIQERSDDGADLPMAISHYTSQVAALRYLGYDVQLEPVGARVTRVLPGTPAEGRLQPGDLVIRAGSTPIRTADDLRNAVRGSSGTMQLELRRDNESLQLELTPVRIEGSARLGVTIETEEAPERLPVAIEIESGNIAGSSAGLIFSLEIVDQLTPLDLTGGRVIAGTGTMSPDGRVYSITGARFKAIAAERSGASIFLCPREDLDEARSAQTGLNIVPVESLAEAIQALQPRPEASH
jgi:PDZ domain-containing protein